MKIHLIIRFVLEFWTFDRTVCIAVGLWYRMMSAHKRWVFQRAAAQQRQRRLALKPPLLFSERWLHDVCYCGLKKCFFIAWPLTTFVQPSIISKLNLLSDYFQEKWNNWGLKLGNDLNKKLALLAFYSEWIFSLVFAKTFACCYCSFEITATF